MKAKKSKAANAQRRMSKTERSMCAALAKAEVGDNVKVWGVGPDHIRFVGVIEALNADGTAMINLGTQSCVLDLDEDEEADPKCWRTDNFWHELRMPNSAKPGMSNTEREKIAALAKAKVGDNVMVWGFGPFNGVIKQLDPDGTALINLGTETCVLDLPIGGRPDPKFWRSKNLLQL